MLMTLYKGKGATHDPNNWSRICLKEMSTKIVSSIIAQRLLAILKHHGCLNQLGHMGCQEALHTVKQVLTIRCHHGHDTYALFIAIMKAFNSINQELLYSILSKFGVTKNMINMIWKVYSNCFVHLEVGKERNKSNLNKSSAGGQYDRGQYDPHPISFHYASSFWITWKKLTYRYFPDSMKNPQKQNGCFLLQDTSSLVVTSWSSVCKKGCYLKCYLN